MKKINTNKQRFFSFLKENNVYVQWRTNIIEDSERDHKFIRYKEKIKETAYREAINYAFLWDNTNEGTEFWHRLDTLYKNTFYGGHGLIYKGK